MYAVIHDGLDERVAITALCLDTGTLQELAAALPPEPFTSSHCNLIAGWCCKHYVEYAEAPGVAGITAIYASWVDTADKDTAELVAKLLQSLPPKLEISTQYAVDLVQDIILKVSAKRLADRVQGSLSQGRTQEAVELIEAFARPVAAKDSDGLFPLGDMDCLARGYESQDVEPLITYSGPVGEFFGPTLCRDGFVSLLAPEKSGKSYHLMGLTHRALTLGRRVAMFNLGDLSESQILRRFRTTAVGRPVGPGEVRLPISLMYEGKEPLVAYDHRMADAGYTMEDVQRSYAVLAGDDSRRFRLVTKSAGTYSVQQLRSTLERWGGQGWVPDVIVVDYAELFAWPQGCKDMLEATNLNWMALRAISTDYHNLVLTATQSNKESYSSWVLGMGNFTASKTKLAHVTAMIGLNVTELEKKLGITRLNYVCLREREFLDAYPGSLIAAAGCPRVGRPYLRSCWI